jgi:hypothetical protein
MPSGQFWGKKSFLCSQLAVLTCKTWSASFRHGREPRGRERTIAGVVVVVAARGEKAGQTRLRERGQDIHDALEAHEADGLVLEIGGVESTPVGVTCDHLKTGWRGVDRLVLVSGSLKVAARILFVRIYARLGGGREEWTY